MSLQARVRCEASRLTTFALPTVAAVGRAFFVYQNLVSETVTVAGKGLGEGRRK